MPVSLITEGFSVIHRRHQESDRQTVRQVRPSRQGGKQEWEIRRQGSGKLFSYNALISIMV